MTQSSVPNPPGQRSPHVFWGIVVLLMGLFFLSFAVLSVPGLLVMLALDPKVSFADAEVMDVASLGLGLLFSEIIWGIFAYSFLVAAYRILTTPPGVVRNNFPLIFPITFGLLLVLGSVVGIAMGRFDFASACSFLAWVCYRILKGRRT